MNFAYVRVSTVGQNEERQIETLKKYNIDKWFCEKVSGLNMERPKLQELLKEASAGDTIYIADFSRLARSTRDLITIIEDLKEHGITLVSEKEQVDVSTSIGKFVVTVLAAVNEFEVAISRERQAEGIEIARREGKYRNCGRKKLSAPENFDDLVQQYASGDITKVQLAVMLNVSRPTLDRILRDYEVTDVF